MPGPTECPSPRLWPRLVAAAAIVLAVLAIITLAAWLSLTSRPSLWLPILNRQLPAGLEITALHGLRPGVSGIAWQRIELDWNGHQFRLDRGRARWVLHQLRPLDAQLVRFEAEHLLAVLAPPDDTPRADWEPLPRFWEEPWWPLVAELSGNLQGFDLLSHAGETVLSGSLQWQPGAQQGEANLFLADTEIAVKWAEAPRADREPGWTALWHSHGSPLGPLHIEGEAQLYWTGEQLGFQAQGQLQGEAVAMVSSDALIVRTDGQIDLFNAHEEPVTGQWSLRGQYDDLEELPIAWQCHGRASLPNTLTPVPQLDRCELTSSAGNAELTGPIVLDWQPLAVRWEQTLALTVTGPHGSGALHVDASTCILKGACDWPLQLTLDQGNWGDISWGSGTTAVHLHRSAANTLRITDLDAHMSALQHDDLTASDLRIALPAMTVWSPDRQPWHVEQLEASAHVELEAAELALTLRGSLTDVHFATSSQWTTQLDVALDPVWQGHHLPTFHLKQQWLQTDDRLDASGALTTRTLDPLLEHRLTIPRDGAPLFTARIDSSVWPAETDITAAVLGATTSLLPIRALHGDLSANLSGRWRDNQLHLDLTGRADRLAGLFGQYAFAGVTLAPFQLRWNAEGLSTADPVHWHVQEFNIGVVLADLSGHLSLQQNRWRLTDVAAKLLGGSAHLDTLSANEGGNLRLDNLDLTTAVALMNQPDLQVSGSLSGQLPVALKDGAPVIRNGTLRNDGPGTIRYRPAPGSDFLRNNPQTAIVGDALSNFHYQRLEADVTYRANGDLLLATRLEGRNPDLEGSPPIHLNLNVEQNVPSLMRSLRAGDDISAWLERRVK